MNKILLSLVVLAALPLRLWAWGVEGHRAIGNIAEHHLSEKARRQVADLLGTQTLTLVSTQPDEMRYLPEYKETSPWHYVNTPLGLAHDQFITTVKAQTEANAYNILLLKIKEMKDPAKTREQRAEALIFVVHIVGDVHQPMHVSRAEDKGGNDIKMTYRGKDTNLHSLWDSGLLDYQGLTYTEMGQQYSVVPEALRKNWQAAADPAEWLFESYTLATQLYAEAAQNPNPDFRYYPAHADIMKQRIQQAGIRLAAVLNEAFK
ncbi:S1/P1 nuclease [Hymenobacter sp. BRD67]|uniref:S1/P1 nuclease n=1 Tax=Hymenobacter sp. BRD67 TaxID=2675877 RepID=UPI001565524D|nr:S1/P1 nuclease [Hymenobacter sp. BRD67]QKG54028.1 S1/P1 nuclease [Hymenobacter sp. BRD67]